VNDQSNKYTFQQVAGFAGEMPLGEIKAHFYR
jgi:hypothetical protein